MAVVRFLRTLAIAVICLSLTGCSKTYYVVIHNAGSLPLHVEYEWRRGERVIDCRPVAFANYTPDAAYERPGHRLVENAADVYNVVLAPDAGLVLCAGNNIDFRREFPLREMRLRTSEGAAVMSGSMLQQRFEDVDSVLQMTID